MYGADAIGGIHL